MNLNANLRLLPLIIALPLCGEALAVGGGSLTSGQLDPITRQIEQRTQRMMEQAMDQQLQEQVQNRAVGGLDVEDALPDFLSIKTRNGEVAFNEVELDTGVRVVERQWLATAPSSNMQDFRQPGITILDRQELDGLGMSVVKFRVSKELDSRQALEAALPGVVLDRNHIYQTQTGSGTASNTSASQNNDGSMCTGDFGVGMVDSSIDTSHPFFHGVDIVQQAFLAVPERGGRLKESNEHGTAVASMMVGSNEQRKARLQGARLFNASVFYGRDRNLSGATLGHLLEGLNWLSNQPLSVINISLTGPPNTLLEQAIKRLDEKGLLMVAAVGNQGPAAPPLYPSAYDEVIGVTAVDAGNTIYRWANQGDQVMFAARGVDVSVARPGKTLVSESGTSLAAPVVTAKLACALSRTGREQAVSFLIDQAQDLGPPGRDPTYGHGLISH